MQHLDVVAPNADLERTLCMGRRAFFLSSSNIDQLSSKVGTRGAFRERDGRVEALARLISLTPRTVLLPSECGRLLRRTEWPARINPRGCGPPLRDPQHPPFVRRTIGRLAWITPKRWKAPLLGLAISEWVPSITFRSRGPSRLRRTIECLSSITLQR